MRVILNTYKEEKKLEIFTHSVLTKHWSFWINQFQIFESVLEWELRDDDGLDEREPAMYLC